MPRSEETQIKAEQNIVPETANRSMYVNGDQQDLSNPDQFTVNNRRRESYGVTPAEALRWVRNPDHHTWKQVGSDRTEEMKDEYDGARVPLNKAGQPLRNGEDLILVAYPREHEDAKQQRLLDDQDEFIGEIAEQRHPDALDLSTMTPNQRMDLMRARRAENRNSGMVGGNSRTSGMSYDDAFTMMGREAGVAKEEARARRGGHANHYDKSVWESTMDSFDNSPRAVKSAKSVAMGDSGFARNPKSPLEQARARGKSK